MNIMIRTLQVAVKEMEKALELESNVLTNQGWIVEVDEVAVKVEFKGGKSTGKISTCLPHKATRFSRENAYQVAKHVTNGALKVGIAVPLVQAIEQEIFKTQRCIELLQSKGGDENG